MNDVFADELQAAHDSWQKADGDFVDYFYGKLQELCGRHNLICPGMWV